MKSSNHRTRAQFCVHSKIHHPPYSPRSTDESIYVSCGITIALRCRFRIISAQPTPARIAFSIEAIHALDKRSGNETRFRSQHNDSTALESMKERGSHTCVRFLIAKYILDRFIVPFKALERLIYGGGGGGGV